MSTADTLMQFSGQKVASLMRLSSGVQIVATPSRQFRKSYKLQKRFIPSFRILSTLSTKLVRPAFYAPSTVTGVSFSFLIGVNNE